MKKTIWMVHAWVVPGWESPQGVFSHDNLHVYCPGNTDLVERHRVLRPPVLSPSRHGVGREGGYAR